MCVRRSIVYCQVPLWPPQHDSDKFLYVCKTCPFWRLLIQGLYDTALVNTGICYVMLGHRVLALEDLNYASERLPADHTKHPAPPPPLSSHAAHA